MDSRKYVSLNVLYFDMSKGSEKRNPQTRKVIIMKNTNRKSIIKGIIANPADQTFTPFEVETEYTRSVVKAVELAREALQLDNAVMVSVSEIVNEKAKRKVYDAQAVLENALETFDTLDEAKAAENENTTAIPYTLYYYNAQVWTFIELENAYQTHNFTDYSPLKFTKVDARAFIRMAAESYFDAKVIGIHNDERTEETRYAIVANDKLELCEKKQA